MNEKGIDDLQITVTAEDDNIVIRLPIELMVFTQENREDPIYIQDKAKMVKYFTEMLLHFQHGGDTRDGSNFENLIDDFFSDALESAEDWLWGWWEVDEINGDGNETD